MLSPLSSTAWNCILATPSGLGVALGNGAGFDESSREDFHGVFGGLVDRLAASKDVPPRTVAKLALAGLHALVAPDFKKSLKDSVEPAVIAVAKDSYISAAAHITRGNGYSPDLAPFIYWSALLASGRETAHSSGLDLGMRHPEWSAILAGTISTFQTILANLIAELAFTSEGGKIEVATAALTLDATLRKISETKNGNELNNSIQGLDEQLHQHTSPGAFNAAVARLRAVGGRWSFAPDPPVIEAEARGNEQLINKHRLITDKIKREAPDLVTAFERMFGEGTLNEHRSFPKRLGRFAEENDRWASAAIDCLIYGIQLGGMHYMSAVERIVRRRPERLERRHVRQLHALQSSLRDDRLRKKIGNLLADITKIRPKLTARR